MDQETDTNTTQENLPVESLSEERLGLLNSRLKLAKAFCKKPHQAFKKWIAEYEIEDVEDTQELRDKIRIAYIFRRVESDLPAVFDDQPELFIKGKGKYKQFDPYIGNTYDWLWDIQRLEEKIEDIGALFILLGMGMGTPRWVTKTEPVYEVVTDPTTQQPILDPATGQPQINQYQRIVKDQPELEPENPFRIYFSPETKFAYSLDYDHCPYYFKEYSMSPEQIKSQFGKEVEDSGVMQTEDSEVNIELDNLKDKSEDKEDVKRIKVYEYFGCMPQDMVKDLQTEWSYDKDYHVWLTKNEELQVEELSAKYPEKPLKIVGNYGLLTKFFRFGDAKHLMNLVREYEQYRSQILKHTRKIANPKTLVPDSMQDIDMAALKDPDPSVLVKYHPGDRGEKPEHMAPAPLGQEVGVGLQAVKTDLEQTSDQFSLSGGNSQSTVRTPKGIQVFSEAADRNTRRKRKKIARFIREVILFEFKLCSQNFDPNDQRVTEIMFGDEQSKVDATEVLKVLGDDNVLAKVDIEVESLAVNRQAIKQDALELLDRALTSEKLFPGLVNLMEIWKDVLQNAYNKKDADRYLTSVDQLKAQGIQEFIQQLATIDPMLATQVAQVIQAPNMMQLQAQQQNQLKPQPQLPTRPQALPQPPEAQG